MIRVELPHPPHKEFGDLPSPLLYHLQLLSPDPPYASIKLKIICKPSISVPLALGAIPSVYGVSSARDILLPVFEKLTAIQYPYSAQVSFNWEI